MGRKSEICVLIPHFNDIEGLKKSLASISNLEPVDVLIVDDGSKEKPDEELLKKEFPNLNISVILNGKNRGIEHVLNDGLKYAKENEYKYIARLDCGDICHKKRFKLQKEVLEKNLDIYLVGSWVVFVDKKGKEIFRFKPPTEYENIKKKMFINNMFVHPAVMFRTEVINGIGYYPTNYKNAEDYAFFMKIVQKYKAINISDYLLICEVDSKGLSLSKRRLQIKSRLKIIKDFCDNSFYCFYGILRNILLLVIPYKLIEGLKKLRYK